MNRAAVVLAGCGVLVAAAQLVLRRFSPAAVVGVLLGVLGLVTSALVPHPILLAAGWLAIVVGAMVSTADEGGNEGPSTRAWAFGAALAGTAGGLTAWSGEAGFGDQPAANDGVQIAVLLWWLVALACWVGLLAALREEAESHADDVTALWRALSPAIVGVLLFRLDNSLTPDAGRLLGSPLSVLAILVVVATALRLVASVRVAALAEPTRSEPPVDPYAIVHRHVGTSAVTLICVALWVTFLAAPANPLPVLLLAGGATLAGLGWWVNRSSPSELTAISLLSWVGAGSAYFTGVVLSLLATINAPHAEVPLRVAGVVVLVVSVFVSGWIVALGMRAPDAVTSLEPPAPPRRLIFGTLVAVGALASIAAGLGPGWIAELINV